MDKEESVKANAVLKESKKHEDVGEKGELARLVAGAVLFAAGVICSVFHLQTAPLIVIFAACLLICGIEVFINAVKNIFSGNIFDENLLMTIAAIGAFSIGKYEESAAVLLFYEVGEYFQDLATRRSKKSITELMDLRPDYANLKTENGTRRVPPQEVKIGDEIEILPGERVPLDGVVSKGHSFVDTSALTGEPAPREVSAGGYVSGGFVNGDGMLTVTVKKTYGESTVAKIIDLVENAGSRKAKAENFITKFSRVYTPAVTGAALLLAVLPPLILHQPFYAWLYRAVIFLVVACPCALVVSIPLSFFAGIGAASRNGILVKGGNFLEKLADVNTIVFDKTGTLTQGVFEVSGIFPARGVTSRELLEAASLAQALSSHPIAKTIIKAAGKEPDKSKIQSFTSTPGMGVVAKTVSGTIAAGNGKLMERENVAYERCGKDGTIVYVARDGRFLGTIVISDIVKPGAAKAVASLKALGIKKTVMLTGDRESAARAVADKIGIDEVRSELLPDEKVAEFEKVAAASGNIAAYVGDGINDAPVLARSDVGIAMGGIGSDAAVEAADIVIMDDNPRRIASAIRISRYVRKIVRQNIVFALAVKFTVLVLGALGAANIWAAVFADTGVTVLAVINSMRALLHRDSFAVNET